jgi:hypothetical protein
MCFCLVSRDSSAFIEVDHCAYVLLFYDSIRTCLSRQIDKGSLTAFSTLVSFRLPSTDQFVDESLTDEPETPAFYICSLERANGHSHWTHQGSEPGLKVRTYQRALPLWIQVIIIVFLMAFSGLFSGLNLGSHYINLTSPNLCLNQTHLLSHRI